MRVITRALLAVLCCLLLPGFAGAAPDATLLRLFLTDGTSVVSYGEFARIEDRVIFSMPAGGAPSEPRLQAVTLPSVLVDWPRTERYAASARYQQYAETRGDEDFQRLSNEVADVLNEILKTRDRTQALEIATRARNTLADWPRQHLGYRQHEVAEIVSLLDEAISNLRAAAGMTMFDLSLVAMAPDTPIEPLAGMPTLREQLDQILHVAALTERSSERVALLQAVLTMLNEAPATMKKSDVSSLRHSTEKRIAAELEIDARYTTLSRRVMSEANRAAAQARVADVERVLNRIPNEDVRLGRRRPEIVQALHAGVQAQLDAALHLRLLRDQWTIRQGLYRDYRRAVGTQILQLVKAQPALEAVRKLEGPSPSALLTLRGRLSGGAERLARVQVPSDLRAAHDSLTGAWRFAENAFNSRYSAIRSGEMTTAWEASSAAAGALMFLSRAQQELRNLLEAATTAVITVRTTRLMRVPDLHAFRDALVALACGGTPFDTRDRFVVVPTRAAAAHLLRSIENRQSTASAAQILPDFITAAELPARLAERTPQHPSALTAPEREALLGVACREAIDAGEDPPFRLRPALVAEILRFYDTLHRNQKDVESFERLALAMLEPGAANDRGAERLVRQTRFLVSAFRRFEQRRRDIGAFDEHALRAYLRETPASRPWRHAVVAVTDGSLDPHGLCRADWDLLSRVPGLERLDVVATDHTVAGAFHERIRDLLPGIDEVRFEAEPRTTLPTLLMTPPARDREEEIAGFARWARGLVRSGDLTTLDRMALVVRQPLPYVYIAREVLGSAGIPCQMFDALPLAAEPYAAALDLVVSCISANCARGPAIALLRSPHFRFEGATPREVSALDRALSEAGYLGDVESLAGMTIPGGAVLRAVAGELVPLRSASPPASHLDTLLAFLTAHENVPAIDDPLRERHLRARAAILGLLTSLRDAFARFDPSPVEFDTVAALVRRWIGSHTFAPRTGGSGVHLVDAESAKFGDFDAVQLAGLVDGEWPERPRRNIFYSGGLLRDLGWPAESDRLDGARAAFRDLLKLPASRLIVSTFTLEDDALTTASTFLDEIEGAGLEEVEYSPPATRIFAYERPANDRPSFDENRYRGYTSGHAPPAYSLSALERYQDCPFKFFANDVLRLEELPEDEPALSPRARGRFIHEVFQRFFEAWDGRGGETITSERLDEARSLFEEVARPLISRLPEADASLEWTRLFGSAISVGIVDVVLGLEASRPTLVKERWLEFRLEGEFALGSADGRRVPLKGVADRIDLLEGNRLRVIDYKSGYPPNTRRALQVPIYSLCAQERLVERDGTNWTVDEAAYVAFTGKRALVPVIKAGGKDTAETLAEARTRLLTAVDGIASGAFPPRPHDPMMCTYCAFPSVCRKDYVGD